MSTRRKLSQNNPMLTPIQFAFALTAHRERLHLTQARMATLLSISVRTYVAWEAGSYAPHALSQEGAIARLAKK